MGTFIRLSVNDYWDNRYYQEFGYKWAMTGSSSRVIHVVQKDLAGNTLQNLSIDLDTSKIFSSGNIRVTATHLGGSGVAIYCRVDMEQVPQIAIENVSVQLYPAGNDFSDPYYPLYGIILHFSLVGPSGSTGKVDITWGNHGNEVFDIADYALKLGNNDLWAALPVATHKICLDMR